MSYQAVFTGWEDLKLKDLLVAYRKAKADCFFENTFPTAVKFAEYEHHPQTVCDAHRLPARRVTIHQHC